MYAGLACLPAPVVIAAAAQAKEGPDLALPMNYSKQTLELAYFRRLHDSKLGVKARYIPKMLSKSIQSLSTKLLQHLL